MPSRDLTLVLQPIFMGFTIYKAPAKREYRQCIKGKPIEKIDATNVILLVIVNQALGYVFYLIMSNFYNPSLYFTDGKTET